MKIGDLYKRKEKEYPAEIMGYPPNLFSHYNKTAETKLVHLKYHGGQQGEIVMDLEEFLELYTLYKPVQEDIDSCSRIFSNIWNRKRL